MSNPHTKFGWISSNRLGGDSISDGWTDGLREAIGPRREKTCLRGFRHSEIQTSLPSYRDALENRNVTLGKFTYETYQKANNKGADQSARMRRLVCVCVVRNPRRQVFSRCGPIAISSIAFIKNMGILNKLMLSHSTLTQWLDM